MHISETSKANRFPKSEKLKLKKQIETLFRNGKAFQFEYLRIIYLLIDNNNPLSEKLKFGVSIPKKKIPKAHDRNKCKRRIREAFRLQKSALYPIIPQGKSLHIFVVYQNNRKIASYTDVYILISKFISKLSHTLDNIQN